MNFKTLPHNPFSHKAEPDLHFVQDDPFLYGQGRIGFAVGR